MLTDNDLRIIEECMALAQRGEGMVNPNPMVGAVIVTADGAKACGWHHAYGLLHAERDALREADSKGLSVEGATMYVSLEPCNHTGHQPPCTEAIIARGIRRVVVGLNDPNPIVAGKGLARLRDAGIEVDVIEGNAQAAELTNALRRQNRVFLKYISTGMPWLTAKWAMTLDGKICTRTGDSRWISNEKSREQAHILRRRHMGILCGIGTVLADDPMLNVRLSPETLKEIGISAQDVRQPVRIVADRHARLPLDSRLATTARDIPTVVAHGADADKDKLRQLQEAGVTLWQVGSLKELLLRAGSEKIDSVMTECGGTLAEALLRESLVDEVQAFIAPKIVGGEAAKTPVEGLGVDRMGQAVELSDTAVSSFDGDILVSGIVRKQE